MALRRVGYQSLNAASALKFHLESGPSSSSTTVGVFGIGVWGTLLDAFLPERAGWLLFVPDSEACLPLAG